MELFSTYILDIRNVCSWIFVKEEMLNLHLQQNRENVVERGYHIHICIYHVCIQIDKSKPPPFSFYLLW